MNKQELLELIRATQKSIAGTMESLQYKINDLDEIRKAVVLLVSDNVKPIAEWTKEDSEILRGEKV